MEDKQYQEKSHKLKLFRQVIDMPIPFYLLLGMGCFIMLLIIMFLSVTRDGGLKLAAHKWILIGVFAFVVEIINQFTYLYAKKNRTASKVLKMIIFWSSFYTCAGIYTLMLDQLPVVNTFNWSTQIGPLMALLLLSMVLPFYSNSPDIRFLLLYGTYHASR